ncbi:MAG: hypothetical protein IJH37_02670 [Clostridia bacterium]|nr:hypothetical protein [Clostridia bacterium]
MAEICLDCFNKYVMNGEKPLDETVADFGRALTNRKELLNKGQICLAKRIANRLKNITGTITTSDGDVLTRREAQEMREQLLSAVAVAVNNREQKGNPDTRYKFVGKTFDGRSIYKTNYPDNTPKSIKQQDLIEIIQNSWAEQPIRLSIVENGVVKNIEARFDPDLSDHSDLAKIAYGNKKGNGSERRITLDLGSDLYQIASESRHNGSKAETGKNNDAHKDVSQWHYFITNVVYKNNSGEYIDGHVNIDVKQKADGNYFYSFAFEKGTAPQSLLAAVSESNSPTIPSDLTISQQNPFVKENIRYSRDIKRAEQNKKDMAEYGISINQYARELMRDIGVPEEQTNEYLELALRHAAGLVKNGQSEAAVSALELINFSL